MVSRSVVSCSPIGPKDLGFVGREVGEGAEHALMKAVTVARPSAAVAGRVPWPEQWSNRPLHLAHDQATRQVGGVAAGAPGWR